MTKYTRNFARLENGVPSWGPIPLLIVTHHREEWDEPVIDPETGEPTGETEHKTRDWDTTETILHPTADDYRRANYLPVEDRFPTEPAKEGYHWERTGKWLEWKPWDIEDSAYIYPEYVEVENPPAPPRRWSSLAIKRVLEARGSWAEVKGLLEAAGVYDDFLMADYIAEDDDAFLAARAEAVKLYGEETVAAILAAIPTEA